MITKPMDINNRLHPYTNIWYKDKKYSSFYSWLKGIKKQFISKTIKRLEGIGSKKNNLIIKAVAILQLFKKDNKQNKINLSRICKYSNPNLFNSFRRDKTNSRQYNCIYS